MTKTFLLATLLGVGCAPRADRAALAPTDAVAIARDLTVTCDAGSQDSFAYDSAAHPDPSTCRRPADDAPQIELDADAPAPTRARAAVEFLAGAPADPPVDQQTLATALRRSQSTALPSSSTSRPSR